MTASISTASPTNQNTAVGNVVSSLSVVEPTSFVNDDMILVVQGNDNRSATDQWDDLTNKPTGTNLIEEEGTASSDCHVAAFQNIFDGTTADPLICPSVTAEDGWVLYLRVINAATTLPIDVVGSTMAEGPVASHSIPGITTLVDDCLVVAVWAFDGGDGIPFVVSGTGWTLHDELGNGVDPGHACGGIATKVQTIKGPTGDCIVTPAASDGFTAFMFSIKPGASGGGAINPWNYYAQQ